jgi:diketogulonate reductase-like aldo/keto reductase
VDAAGDQAIALQLAQGLGQHLLEKLAAEKGVSASQLAIAWVLAKGRNIVPLIGSRTRKQLTESLGALAVDLTPEDLARIEEAVPASEVAGSRYGEQQMQMLDSERSARQP